MRQSRIPQDNLFVTNFSYRLDLIQNRRLMLLHSSTVRTLFRLHNFDMAHTLSDDQTRAAIHAPTVKNWVPTVRTPFGENAIRFGVYSTFSYVVCRRHQ